MPWVRFDDQFPIHRKVDGLSDRAFRLHISAIFWCARNLTDGHVPVDDLWKAAPKGFQRPSAYVPELTRTNLWAENGDGWIIHDYLDYQPSREKIEKERKAKAARQRRWMDKARRSIDASTDTSQDMSIDASLSTGVDASIDTTPPRPAPPRLRAGAGPPPQSAGARGRANPPGSPAAPGWEAWCGQCDNPKTRLVEDADGRVARCPNCHPASLPTEDPR